MTDQRKCAECGSAIPDASRDGRCPRCLVGLALNATEVVDSSRVRMDEWTNASGRVFGNYELLERIGQGGMGIVFKARQRNLNRIVALKLMLSGPLATEAEIKRFRGEANSAATLQHPHVVAIHEVGEQDGHHYFSMDYVEGQSLGDVVRRTPLPAQQAVRYVKTIAEAIHYAHQHGILHRDLKPDNVLIDAHDQPRITDFGLAKQITVDSELTASGAVLGTPSYMPPEQAAGKRREIGPASDVYSIGAILYDLLTGRPPFRAETPLDTLRQVLDAEPAAPRLLNRKVPRDLEVICLKCLAKEPQRRYATAQELADDLGRFARSEPILARPPSGAERIWRWCRRHPAEAGLLGTSAVLLLLMAAAAILFRRDTLDNNVHAARLAAGTVHAELSQLGRLVEETATSAELRELLPSGDSKKLEAFARQAFLRSITNAGSWLRFENWLVMDPAGHKLVRWPEESHLADRSFRDYFRGAASSNSSRVYFSRVYHSFDDSLYKFAISRAVRDTNGALFAVVAASVGTSSTEGRLGLTTAQRKTVLVARCDTNPPNAIVGATNRLPDFVIMLHPAFHAREAAVPIRHPHLQSLVDAPENASAQQVQDGQFRDPVAARYPQYLGRWLAGFAPVTGTPFVIIYQTRDWVSDAVFFAAIFLGLGAFSYATWRVARRWKQKHQQNS